MNEWNVADIESEIFDRNNALIEQRRYYDSLHFNDLYPFNADDYYDGLKDLSKFKEPSNTIRKDAEKDSGISKFLKFKAWFSDSSKAELEDKRMKAAELERQYTTSNTKRVNRQRESFYQKQKENNKGIDEMLQLLMQHDANEVREYFQAVLSSDQFTLDLMGTNQIYHSIVTVKDYDVKLSELSYSLRIPNPEEICVIDRFLYSDKEDQITSHEFDVALCRKVRLNLVRAILLRSAAMVYCSDTYENIKSVNITGYLRYYEPAFANYKKIDVVKVKIVKEIFEQLNPERLKLEELFVRVLKAKEASGLYSKEPYEMKDVKTKLNSR